MNGKELRELISAELAPLGYRRLASDWIKDSDEVTKVINLQKSNFSNQYYLNYDYILKNIPLEGIISHFGSRFGAEDLKENKRITQFLDLENITADDERTIELRNFIRKFVLEKVEQIRTEEDLKQMLERWEPKNMIPGVTKRYFGLREETHAKPSNQNQAATIIRRYKPNGDNGVSHN